MQNAGTVVVAAKAGKGSATLSMGFAGARLGSAALAGLAGTPTTECAYVASNVTELPYFASKVTFGEKGVETVHPLGDLSPHEQARSPEVTRDHPRLPEREVDIVWRVSLHSPPPTSRGAARGAHARPQGEEIDAGIECALPPAQLKSFYSVFVVCQHRGTERERRERRRHGEVSSFRDFRLCASLSVDVSV